MVATLIEAFGNNFNDDDKCDNCDRKDYLVKSCYMNGLKDNPKLCNNSLAQYGGISQNCQYDDDGKYCTPGKCMMGIPDSIDASCKSTKYGGKLKNPICTGVYLENDCKGDQTHSIPRYLQKYQPVQNYGTDGTKYYFCKYEAGSGPWIMTNSQCELKQ